MDGAAWVKWSQSDPSRNKNIKQFYVKQKIGGKIRNGGKISRTKNYVKHDKIIKYFLHWIYFTIHDWIYFSIHDWIYFTIHDWIYFSHCSTP
jgi:hypothetical protein